MSQPSEARLAALRGYLNELAKDGTIPRDALSSVHKAIEATVAVTFAVAGDMKRVVVGTAKVEGARAANSLSDFLKDFAGALSDRKP